MDGREPRVSIDAGLQNPIPVETTVYNRKLGIFLQIPVPGEIKTRLARPLTAAEARDLHRAFLADLFARISRLKKISATVFYAGEDTTVIQDLIPSKYPLVPQEGASPAERLENAFRKLLGNEGNVACIIGSKSPDLPLVYLKRAYVKLKHRDVVLGPTFDGGCYLIALKRLIPDLLQDVAWGETGVLGNALGKVQSKELSCALLPPWYDVDTMESLSLLKTMLLARKIEGRDRLRHVERVLDTIHGTER